MVVGVLYGPTYAVGCYDGNSRQCLADYASLLSTLIHTYPGGHQVILTMQANPINHIQQQHVMYEMDMYRAQKLFEM